GAEGDPAPGAGVERDAREDPLHPPLVCLLLGRGVCLHEVGREPAQPLECVEREATPRGLLDRCVARRAPRVEIVGELLDRVPVELLGFEPEAREIWAVVFVSHRHCSIRTMMLLRARASSPRTVEVWRSSSSAISSYEYPPYSRSTQQRRWSSGSSPSARLSSATPTRVSTTRGGVAFEGASGSTASMSSLGRDARMRSTAFRLVMRMSQLFTFAGSSRPGS